MINEKISEIKTLSENKVMKLALILDEMQSRLHNYEKNDSSLHMLFQLPVEDIFAALPKLQENVALAMHLFV